MVKANSFSPGIITSMLLFLALPLSAATFYVDLNNAAPAPPYASWTTAATNIQDAIDAASAGDLVLVTNGVYVTGGKVMAGNLTNRVALDKTLTVQSVNGPWVTTIRGAWDPNTTNGPAAVRCAWLTNNAALIGFTLQGGATRSTSDSEMGNGGGVWCASANSLVGNCVITFNSAVAYGGGIYQGAVQNSLIRNNYTISLSGGAACMSILNNCTIVSNATLGVFVPIAMTNCIIYFNGSYSGNNFSGPNLPTFANCCIYPGLSGAGNITNAPQFLSDGVHLANGCTCIGAGANTAQGTDIFGQPWGNPPSIGCAEWTQAPFAFAQVSLSRDRFGVTFTATVSGASPLTYFWLSNGVPLQDASAQQTTNLLVPNVDWSNMPSYQIVVSNTFGCATSAPVQLAVHLVDSNGRNPVAPYLTWAAAATNIQDAIDAASDGDYVLVTNGVYATGGKVMAGDLTNRVVLDKALTVQSVNGPWVTTIRGAWDPATNGPAAIRCAWLTNNAALIGFTLQGGATRTTGDQALGSGGGAWCASSNSLVGNCVIASNSGSAICGGVFQGTVQNSLIRNNYATPSGGAVYKSILNNCTIVSNVTFGAYSPLAMTNCIIYFNGPSSGYNYINYPPASANCCTYPSLPGTGNITDAPQFLSDGVHLANGCACIGAGTNVVQGTDIFGQPWANPPSIGCAEWSQMPFAFAQVSLSRDLFGMAFTATVSGASPLTYFWLRNGEPLQEANAQQTTNLLVPNVDWGNLPSYQIVVSNAFGCVTSAPVQLAVHLVDSNGRNPVAPYLTWGTAATNIQDAIDAAAAGEVVLVTNGVYATGGKSMDGVITNRIAINKAILVQSVNGPETTLISGERDTNSIIGPGAMRCVWMTTNSILSGFKLSGGATRLQTPYQAEEGGGVLGDSTSALVHNCIISNNFAAFAGGGAYSVSLKNCRLEGNYVSNSIASSQGGGGAAYCNLANCLITGNSTLFRFDGGGTYYGGGTYSCNATNCAFTQNHSARDGYAAYQGKLVNCTLVGNACNSSQYGSAATSATLINCIVYGNTNNPIYQSIANYNLCTFSYSLTDPLPPGDGNITADPKFLADGLHLAEDSPCRGAGNPAVVSGTDIDGQPWNNPPSMGCDEWQPEPLMPQPPTYQVAEHNLLFNIIVAGQSPFECVWSKDGVALSENDHYRNTATTGLTLTGFGPEDSGTYQVIASNAFGAVTSQVVQVNIHAVDANSVHPVPPYLSWATAAATIQDAVDAAAAGEIVLVTNGLYATGSKTFYDGNITDRVAVDKPLTVISVNGCRETVIQGAWDPVSTNGPAAIRCVELADGAALIGFTVQNGATAKTAAGGGICGASYNSLVANCILTNNASYFGGGCAFVTIKNSLIIGNLGSVAFNNGITSNYGTSAGAYSSKMINCTVIQNNMISPYPGDSAGICSGEARNCIIVDNYRQYGLVLPSSSANYPSAPPYMKMFYSSCTLPLPPSVLVGDAFNTDAAPQFLDSYHIAITSPCYGTGKADYTSGVDLDGEPWNNPPSMGCDEVVPANLTGPLAVSIATITTNLVVNHDNGFWGTITGRAYQATWDFGDGATTNSGTLGVHRWLNPGDYTVTLTAYNHDYPDGVATNLMVRVEPLNPPVLQATMTADNRLQLQFMGQPYLYYYLYYTTNLTAPITWTAQGSVFSTSNGVMTVTLPVTTDPVRFYHVETQ